CVPPAGQGMDRELGSRIGHSHVDEAFVSGYIVNAKRDRPTLCHSGKIVLMNLLGFPPPRPSVVSEFADKFFFLGVHADDWKSSAREALLLGRDVLELLIPLRASRSALLPLVGLQREAHILKQTPHDTGADVMTFLGQLLGDVA